MMFLVVLIAFFSHELLRAESVKIDHEKEIVFGQSGVFSGPMGLYGQTIKDGINAYFSRVNQQGGVKSKKIRLISREDKSSLALAQKNMEYFKEQGITMFIGNMGTHNVLSLSSALKTNEIGLFFPWSGDVRLQDASLTSLVNGPGLMEPQTDKLADYVIEQLGHKRVAIFHGDDSFSTAAAEHFADVLRKRGLEPLASVYYNRFTLDIITSAQKLLSFDPRAVVCIGTSVPVTKLINYFFERGHYATTFLGIDSTLFVSDQLRGKNVPFFYTSAVPDPKTSTIPLAKQYLHDIARYCPQETPNVLSFTYYMSAAILVEAIKNVDGELTIKSIMDALGSMRDYDLHGFLVNFDAKTRYAYGKTVSLIKG